MHYYKCLRCNKITSALMFHFPLHLYPKVVQYYCLSGGNTNYSTIFPFLSHSDMHKSDLKLAANVSIINFSLFTRRFRVVLHRNITPPIFRVAAQLNALEKFLSIPKPKLAFFVFLLFIVLLSISFFP